MMMKHYEQILNFAISFVIGYILRHRFCGPKFLLSYVLFQFYPKFVKVIF